MVNEESVVKWQVSESLFLASSQQGPQGLWRPPAPLPTVMANSKDSPQLFLLVMVLTSMATQGQFAEGKLHIHFFS